MIGSRSVTTSFCVAIISSLTANVFGADKTLRLLIVDGQNNHNYEKMRPILKKTLEDTGRFTVDVATTPPINSSAGAWLDFHPDFTKYDVVLSNYNDQQPRHPGDRWPPTVENALERYVATGGGLFVLHAANNAFANWKEWNRMIGLGWRHKEFGDRIYLDEQGKVIRVPKGEGTDASHGKEHAFKITVRDLDHPVMKGMPIEWMHGKDELYHSQRGPAVDLHILASAYSDPKENGTGKHEPLIWTTRYGKGRVFTCLLGHLMDGPTSAIDCVGFQTVLSRGAEWAANGRVTVPLPKNFPTTTAPSTQ